MGGYWRFILAGALVVVLIGAFMSYKAWVAVFGPSAQFDEDGRVLFIHPGADLDAVVDSLLVMGAIRDERGFMLLAERKNYATRVRPGRYRIRQGMSMNEVLNMLRAGEQEPVRVTFNNIAHLEALAGRVAQHLQPDSLAFAQTFLDAEVQASAGYDRATFISMFIPDTYEFWWTTSPELFVARMRREHGLFWNEARLARARALGMDPDEVSTLASIVQAETGRMEDASRIAGVYLNRLRIGMPLQADPTLKFALGLDSINRVLHRDKEVDSPYNTYRNTGLPPGPINMPEPRFLDAVLDAGKHDYLYFCARADLSGHSDFARTYEQHLVNARKYQRALNERGIMR